MLSNYEQKIYFKLNSKKISYLETYFFTLTGMRPCAATFIINWEKKNELKRKHNQL